MKITTTKTKRGRINIIADGEYQFTVSALFWAKNGCPEGGTLEADALRDLQTEADADEAYNKALRLLSLRAHGTAELRRKLRRDFDREAAEAALERCAGNGLLDDEAFARDYAEGLFRGKAYSPERIEQALREKGIDREIAKNAVFALDIDRKSGIIRIIEKMKLPETITRKDADRLLRRLHAAGYTMREIREVVDFSGAEESFPEE